MNEYYKDIIEYQKEMIEILSKRGRISAYNKGVLGAIERSIERLEKRIDDFDKDDDLI